MDYLGSNVGCGSDAESGGERGLVKKAETLLVELEPAGKDGLYTLRPAVLMSDGSRISASQLTLGRVDLQVAAVALPEAGNPSGESKLPTAGLQEPVERWVQGSRMPGDERWEPLVRAAADRGVDLDPEEIQQLPIEVRLGTEPPS
jgi:hypothetical protein